MKMIHLIQMEVLVDTANEVVNSLLGIGKEELVTEVSTGVGFKTHDEGLNALVDELDYLEINMKVSTLGLKDKAIESRIQSIIDEIEGEIGYKILDYYVKEQGIKDGKMHIVAYNLDAKVDKFEGLYIHQVESSKSTIDTIPIVIKIN